MEHKMTRYIQWYGINDSKQLIEILHVGYNRTEWIERRIEAKHSGPLILSSMYRILWNNLELISELTKTEKKWNNWIFKFSTTSCVQYLAFIFWLTIYVSFCCGEMILHRFLRHWKKNKWSKAFRSLQSKKNIFFISEILL